MNNEQATLVQMAAEQPTGKTAVATGGGGGGGGANQNNPSQTSEQLPSLANNKDIRIAGKYIIGDKIGSGAFGDIYVGKRRLTN